VGETWGGRAIAATMCIAVAITACTSTHDHCEDTLECDAGTDHGVGDAMTEHDAAMCSGTTPVRSDMGSCIACESNDECVGNAGGSACSTSGACVACVHDTDCSGGHACNETNNTCFACVKDTDCESGVCDSSKCVDSGSVAYVDQDNCASPKGTQTNPYCQVNDAFTTPQKSYVVVKGTETGAYNAVAVPPSQTLTLTIVGPGRAPNLGATAAVSSVSSIPALSVSPAGGVDQNIRVRGLELLGSQFGSGSSGVSCSQASGGVASLIVEDCLVHKSGAVGVSSAGCTLTMERNLVEANVGSLIVNAGTYVVENNAFIGSATPTSTVPLQILNASGTFAFNTVINHLTTGGAVGGIDCGSSGTTPISASIVFNNTQQSHTQFGPRCQLNSTVVSSDDMTTGGIPTTPNFADAYHLAATGNALIIDAVPSTIVPTTKLDIDGDIRPQGKANDIGADEVK
jgi:hypothetical protein